MYILCYTYQKIVYFWNYWFNIAVFLLQYKRLDLKYLKANHYHFTISYKIYRLFMITWRLIQTFCSHYLRGVHNLWSDVSVLGGSNLFIISIPLIRSMVISATFLHRDDWSLISVSHTCLTLPCWCVRFFGL